MNPYSPPDVRLIGQLHQHHQQHHHPHHPHQSRYANMSSSPRPPNLPYFSDNSNYYAPQILHIYHHRDPHQQSRHPLPPILHPPTPAYHPSSAPLRPLTSTLPQHEFVARGFNSMDDDLDQRLTYHHHHDSPTVETHAELLDWRQTIGDNMAHRPYSGADLNLDLHRRAIEHRAASPYGLVDSSRRGLEPTSRVRLREDYAGELGYDWQDDILRGSSLRLASVAGGYDDQRHRNERVDNMSGRYSWVHNRENIWDLGDSSSEITDYGTDVGKDFRTIALKQEYHGSKLGRYSSSNRSSREVVHEYSLTPKKQLQKKSAFLRLQMPRFNRKNREKEWHYSSDYHDEHASGSLSFKGNWQEQFSCSHHGPKDSGEGGSVDLDVSFKSNTLIAKSIIPPPSSRVIPERDSNPLSKKLKSAIGSDRDIISSSLDKLDQSDEKLSFSCSVIGVAIGTNKNSKQLFKTVGASGAQYRGNLGCLEGTVSKFDDPVKSESCSLHVSKVTNISSSNSEVGKSNLSLIVDKAGIDLQCRKNAVFEGQDSKAGAKRDIVFDKVGKSFGSSQGKNAKKEFPGKAPSAKDSVPEGQDSNAGRKKDAVSSKDGKNVGSGQDKTADKGLPGKAHIVKDAVAGKQDSGASAKRDVVLDDGKNGDSSQSKTADKGLPVKAPSIKVAEKKKTVKKVVKKAVTHREDPLNWQTPRKNDESMKAGSCTASASRRGSGSSKERVELCSVALSQDYGLTHESNEACLLQHIDQMKGASHSISSERCGKDTYEGTEVLCDNKDRDCSSSSLCVITSEETKAGAPDATSSVYNLHIVSSPQKDLVVPLAQADARVSVDEFSGQLLQDMKCLLLENQAEKDHLAGDRSTTCLSHSGGFNVQDGCIVLDGSSLRQNAACGTEEDLVGFQDLPIVSGKESIGAAEYKNSEACQMTTVLCEDSQSITKTGACWVFGSSSTVNSEENVKGLGSVLSHDTRRQLPQMGDPRKPHIGSKWNPENFVSTLEDLKECAPNTGRSQDEISRVDSLSSRETDICSKPVDVSCSGHSHVEDTVLALSINDPDPAIFSSLGGVDCWITCNHLSQ